MSAHGLATWDGSSWSAFGGVPGVEVTCLLAADLGVGPELFATGRVIGTLSGTVSRWTGSSWQIIGMTTGNSGPKALAVFDDGGGPALYVGGQLSSIDGVPGSAVMRWAGSSWVAVGPTGLLPSAIVRALAVYDDGIGPALYAGGSYSMAVGKMTSPGNWAPVGGDVHGGSGTGVTVETCESSMTDRDRACRRGLRTGGTVPSSGIAKWGPLRPSLEALQAAPGAPVVVRNSWLLRGRGTRRLQRPAVLLARNRPLPRAVRVRSLAAPARVFQPPARRRARALPGLVREPDIRGHPASARTRARRSELRLDRRARLAASAR